jgi:uncharacterized membrane protein SpoIIM required for sporulation
MTVISAHAEGPGGAPAARPQGPGSATAGAAPARARLGLASWSGRSHGFDIERFIKERQPRWVVLERLLDDFNEQASEDLGRQGVLELVRLYRIACSDLNQARSYTGNPELIGRLNHLVGRAYRTVYQAAPGLAGRGSIRHFLLVSVPEAFRAEARQVLTASCIFLVGALIGLAAVLSDPANGEVLIPAEFFTERPSERVQRIEQDPERIESMNDAAAFGSMLYTHNMQVAFLAFSAGALTLAGGWLLLLYNGLILGAVGGMYSIDGVGTFFLAWVGPHGALELPAIIFASAAGLRLGRALLTPGEFGRAEAVRAVFPTVYRMMVTTALVLIGAGIIEGSFSQFSAKVVPYGVKIAIAGALFMSLCSWLFWRRRLRSAP